MLGQLQVRLDGKPALFGWQPELIDQRRTGDARDSGDGLGVDPRTIAEDDVIGVRRLAKPPVSQINRGSSRLASSPSSRKGLSNDLAVWRNLWSDGADLARHAHQFITEQLFLNRVAA